MAEITTAQVTSQPKITSSLKLIANKTHRGPISEKKQTADKLSEAANKIRLNNNLKVEVGQVSDAKKVSVPTTESLLISNKDVAANHALLYLEAWDKMYGDPGTPDYVSKANALSKAQAEAYKALGIQTQAGVRPELTEEQREAYNRMVWPYAFDYYEVRLSYKQPGQKSVRSTTYRMLQRPDLNRMRRNIQEKAKSLSTKIKVSVVPNN